MLEKSNLAIRINKKAEFVLNHAKDPNRKIPEILKRFSQNDLKTFFHNTLDIENTHRSSSSGYGTAYF